MKELKKILFFIITYNLIFILILNSQYMYRFNASDNMVANITYSAIMSMYFSIIPLICLCFSSTLIRLISRKSKINPVLKSAIFLMVTVILTFILIRIMSQDPVLTLITIVSTTLTLLLFLFRYRKSL